MKNYKVTIAFQGLTGDYKSVLDIKARTEKAAYSKAYDHIGDRSWSYIDVKRVDTHRSIGFNCPGIDPSKSIKPGAVLK